MQSPNGMFATLQLFLNTLCRSIKLYLRDKFGWTRLQFMCFKLEGKNITPLPHKKPYPQTNVSQATSSKESIPTKRRYEGVKYQFSAISMHSLGSRQSRAITVSACCISTLPSLQGPEKSKDGHLYLSREARHMQVKWQQTLGYL